MPIIRSNGIDHHVDVEGNGRPVLFIHGGFGGAESTLFPRPSSIAGVLPPERFRTISYDRRNSGRSAYDLRRTRLEDLAADARGILDGLGDQRAIVVGDSLGGMIAQRFALDYPQAVESLVLMETSARILRRTLSVRAALLALNLLGPRVVYRRFRRRFLEPNWSKPIGPAASEDELAAAHERHLELRRRLAALPDETLYSYSLGLVRTYVAFSGRDLRGELRRLAMAVRVLHGDADTIVGAHHGRELAGLIPDASLLELPGLGHGLLYYPEGRDALRETLESLTGEGAAVSV